MAGFVLGVCVAALCFHPGSSITIEAYRQIQLGMTRQQVEEILGGPHRNESGRWLRCLRNWDAIVATIVGNLGDALGDESGSVVAPIKERPDFEHLEAKGISLVRRIAARQRRRKKGSS